MTTPATPVCSISGNSRKCSSSTSGPGSIRSGTGTPIGYSPTPRCRSAPPNSLIARPARSWASTSRGSAAILSQVAKEEARHYTFYRTVFEEILKRDPDQALHSASFILPAIDMPGVTMPGFKELADVIRRAGIYGPRDYLRIVQEQIRYWKIESLQGLNELGRKAQEKIMGIPARFKRIAEHMETRSKSKTFSFEVVFNREFAME